MLVGLFLISIVGNAETEKTSLVIPAPVVSEIELVFSRKIPAPDDYSEEFYRTQAESVSAYRQMLEGFSMQTATFALSEQMATNSDVYPDYYGGSYIEEGTGKLVVLVKGEMSEYKSEIEQLTEESSNVLYKSCEVSYNEMQDMIEAILEKASVLENNGVELCSVEERIMEGKILIAIKDFTEEKAEIARQIIQCNYLQVEAAQETRSDAALVRAGNEVGCDGAYGTYGFAAKKDGAA